jgi:CHAD domain-containing protein
MGLKKHNWIVIEAEGTPACEVAGRTLRHRLDAVWAEVTDCMAGGVGSRAEGALAAEPGGSGRRTNAERVHRLRVATRRALAAFDSFADVVPRRRQAWFRKRLRRLRRAAGNARDLDVLTARLANVTARGRLVAMLSRQRDVSRQPIRDVYEELLAADWTGRVERLIARVESIEPASRRAAAARTSFGHYARLRFRPLMARFFSQADQRLRTAEEMHDLRIEGKKLRYALEIFAGVFPPGVRKSCEQALERLQETLGKFTDHASAADRFRRWSRDERMAADRATLIELEREEAARADSARKVFSVWWNASRRRTLRRTFERSLSRESA